MASNTAISVPVSSTLINSAFATVQKVKHRIRQHGQYYRISQLCMDELPIHKFTPEIMKLLQKCINVEYITFQHCQLKSLTNLPYFEKLQNLQLGFNQIQGNQILTLTKYKNLTNLNLSNNKIQFVQHLKCLSQCKQLTKLLINNNPLCKQNYRAQIFIILPQLQTIDNINKMGQFVNDEKQNDSQDSSQFSESDVSESQGQQQVQRQSPNKYKKKN